ncbi:unnamed protein product [Brachionus calyciflorus]|uniref:Ig-like domain-containing protein n=1 Tax=Brachionus calyciflorus TaxID=104777 RepID=A0A813M0W4_9BILA|nr:unnamed protein product [Brachionus calyciflorus]
MNFILIFVLIDSLTCYDEALNEDSPKMITGNVNITAFSGETVTLPCEVINLGNHHVNWLRIQNNIPQTLTVGYQQFSRNMRFRVARTHDSNEANRIESWNFEIRKVTLEDQGTYQCYIKLGPKHKIKANVNLIVTHHKEKNMPKKDTLTAISDYYVRSERLSSNSLEKIDVFPNSWIKLRCNATGLVSLATDKQARSSFELQWFKDGTPIEPDMRRLKKWVSSYDNSNYMELELYAVEPDDSGVYQCKKDKSVLKNVLIQVLENDSNSKSKCSIFNLIYTFLLVFFMFQLN